MACLDIFMFGLVWFSLYITFTPIELYIPTVLYHFYVFPSVDIQKPDKTRSSLAAGSHDLVSKDPYQENEAEYIRFTILGNRDYTERKGRSGMYNAGKVHSSMLRGWSLPGPQAN